MMRDCKTPCSRASGFARSAHSRARLTSQSGSGFTDALWLGDFLTQQLPRFLPSRVDRVEAIATLLTERPFRARCVGAVSLWSIVGLRPDKTKQSPSKTFFREVSSRTLMFLAC